MELYRSEYHPETSDEGGIDPLGIAMVADRLGALLLPGLLERHKRPRFLSICSVGLSIIDDVKAQSPESDWKVDYWEAFEWAIVTGLVSQHNERLFNLPSSDKTKSAKNNKVPLTPERYLKIPSVFGFHGVYKFLLKELKIESNDRLGEKGFELLKAWATDQKLNGFLPGEKGAGREERQKLIRIVGSSLREGHLTERWGNPYWEFIGSNFHHLKPGKQEKERICSLLYESSHRKQIVEFIISKQGRKFLSADTLNERAFYEAAKTVVSKEIQPLIQAILDYETLARTLTDAFTDVLHALTTERYGMELDKLAKLQSLKGIHTTVKKQIKTVREDIVRVVQPNDLQVRFLPLEGFLECSTERDFVTKLINHHSENQKRKPPRGKNPWLIQSDGNKWLVRPGYFRDEMGTHDDRFVHFYRLGTLRLFVKDLGLDG